MKSKITNSSLLTVEYEGFNGIDRSDPFSGKGTLSDIVNFRLLNDGSLKKRPAAIHMTTLGDRPRAYYERGDGNALLLAGNRFGILNTETFSFTSITTVATTSGAASFFCYEGQPYLMDGNELYICGEDGLTTANGYAPLYGKNWDPNYGGEVNEQQNLLSDRIRVSFLIGETAPTMFMFNIMLKSIDAVYLDNVRVSTSKFIIQDGRMSVSCGLQMNAGSSIMFYATTDPQNSSRSLLTSLTKATIFGTSEGRGADSSSVAFYKEGSSSQVICTRRIDRESYEASVKVYSDTKSLYVTSADIITIGDGTAPLRAACRRGSRLMLFTENEAYALTEAGETAFAFHISDHGGCSSTGAVLSLQGSPVTISKSGILKWSPINYDNDEYVAECISIPIGGLTSDSFFQNAVTHFNGKSNELWFADPASSEKRVFIFNTLSESWYSYSNIPADGFFDARGRLGFFSGKKIFIMDESSATDICDGKESPIIGCVVTSPISFGDFGSLKRLNKLNLRTSPDCFLKISVTDALDRSFLLTAGDTSGEQHGYISLRVSAARSRYYSISVLSSDASSDTLHGMSVSAVN